MTLAMARRAQDEQERARRRKRPPVGKLGMASERAPNISEKRDPGGEDLAERPHEVRPSSAGRRFERQADQQQQGRTQGDQQEHAD